MADDDVKAQLRPLKDYLRGPTALVETATQAAHREYSTKRAAVLLSCFRRTDADEPEVFLAAIGSTLARYPRDIVDAVTGLDGIVAKQTFPPSVAEVRAACDAIVRERKADAERDQRIADQLAERDRIELARREAPTRDEVERQLGRPIGDRPRHHPPTPAAIATKFKLEHGLSDAQWAAIPNRVTP